MLFNFVAQRNYKNNLKNSKMKEVKTANIMLIVLTVVVVVAVVAFMTKKETLENGELKTSFFGIKKAPKVA